MSIPASPSILGQALSWAGSAVAAAAVLSGVAALVVALPPPGESRGQLPAPVVLTLAAPEAVAALPTPPPEVSSDAPEAPPPPDAALPPPKAVADLPPVVPDAPRLTTPAAMADAPMLPDDVPPPPEPAQEPAPEPVPEPVAEPAPMPPAPPAKPDPKPAKAEPAAESPVAASTAGDAGKTPKASRNDGVKASNAAAKQAMQRWGSTIRKRIEARKAYPAAANGAQGSVTVRLTVSRTGQLLGVAVVQSSGTAALDRAAVKAVQSARFPAAPEAVAEDSASFSLPMKFAN